MKTTRTRSFPSRDIGSARGEAEIDDVGNGEFLEKLSTLCLIYPHPENCVRSRRDPWDAIVTHTVGKA